MPLQDLIIDTIRTQGPLSFHDFMEMALYHPGQGYYAASRDAIGEAGDFYTSPYLSDLFGEIVAGQLEEMWMWLDRRPFTIVECGAGAGLLCRDILHRLRNNPGMFDHLQYIIIEKSEWMRKKEQALLAAEGLLPKLRWASSLRELPHIHGCILSNELFDNFPVHQVVMGDRLMEVFVGYENGFREVLRPASPALTGYLREFQIVLPNGFRAEINLQATEWIRDAAAALASGFVLTIDYGHCAADLYSRQTGTLACYHRHRVARCPFEHIGKQDITTHVNFSALDHWGRRYGLEYCGYTSQTRFLQGLGMTARLRREGVATPQLRKLIEMSERFKVLIQRKGLPRVFLSGLQFAQALV
ncbi:MAG TPA: SAM-dependent methyltransferase [Puia sp.]|uniref:class I SAM-dependent methyltransferase n=1 Tax=Puia sp. TaxID=2045100 RepID=UPI002BA64C6D|nr:SAM-dependent methyltransferase [Puia sp.]HVU98170.1 SAM-dependent methyltransferase [Puia sp.]